MLGSQPLGKEFLTAAPHPVGKMHLHLWIWQGPFSVLWRAQDKSTCCTKYMLSVCHLVWSGVARLLTKHPLCGFSTSVEEFQCTHRSRRSQELGAGREFLPPLCLFHLCFWDVGVFGKLGAPWKIILCCFTFIFQNCKITRIVKWPPLCPSYRCLFYRWSAGFHECVSFSVWPLTACLGISPRPLHAGPPGRLGGCPTRCSPGSVEASISVNLPVHLTVSQASVPLPLRSLCHQLYQFQQVVRILCELYHSLHYTFEKQRQTGGISPFPFSIIALFYLATMHDPCSNVTDLPWKRFCQLFNTKFNLWFTLKVDCIALGLCLTRNALCEWFMYG